MQKRLRLLMGATALLYFGPLLAGLGGFGWSLVPVFVAIFLLWLFILRPHQWPRRAADWLQAQALVALAAQAAVQVLLVTVLFGVGRGIGGVLGTLPAFPVMLPVAISFLSVPLSRLVWDPWKAAEMDSFLDEALQQITTPSAPRPSLADHLLIALPTGLTETETAAHLDAMGAEVAASSLADALLAGIAKDQPNLRLALIVHATTAAVAEATPPDYPATAFANMGPEDGLARIFATRCAAMLSQNPKLWPDCPNAQSLDRRAETADPETRAALQALAEQMRRLDPDLG